MIMKQNSFKNTIARASMTLALMVLTTMTAWATSVFVSHILNTK